MPLRRWRVLSKRRARLYFTTRRIIFALLLVFALVFLTVYAFVPEFRRQVNTLVVLVVKANVTPLRDYLLEFGMWAPFLSAGLQLMTAIIAPLPWFVPAVLNGLLFGFWWGLLLTWVMALVGASACFVISRSLGRPTIERLIYHRAVETTDRFFERYGVYTVFLARLVPIINPDTVSYVAGFTNLSWELFILSIALGSLPSLAMYCYLGAHGVTTLGWIVLPLIAISFATLLIALWRGMPPFDQEDELEA